jgi:hypothetical protein
MTVGTVCEARCVGAGTNKMGSDEAHLRSLGLVAAFVCDVDGTWKGELMCPTTDTEL